MSTEDEQKEFICANLGEWYDKRKPKRIWRVVERNGNFYSGWSNTWRDYHTLIRKTSEVYECLTVIIDQGWINKTVAVAIKRESQKLVRWLEG